MQDRALIRKKTNPSDCHLPELSLASQGRALTAQIITEALRFEQELAPRLGRENAEALREPVTTCPEETDAGHTV